jgi:hypothetical protein
MAWLYAPGLVASSSESTWPSLPTKPFVMLSGTPTRRPPSWRGWKTRPWIRLLSGMTCSPSTAARGVASWISSLRASRVSRGAAPGSGKGRMTTVGSGRLSSASFATWNRDSSSWRTCQGSLFTTDSVPFSGTWPRLGSMRSGRCWARATWERRTSGGGCSFSVSGGTAWSTPCSGDTGSRTKRYAQGGTPLSLQGTKWPTPRSGCHGEPNEGLRHPTILGRWANTPRGRDWKAGGKDCLGPQAQTATGPASRSGCGRLWTTPKAIEIPTGVNAQGGESLTTQVGNKKRLNPNFVDWLMGLPPGWSSTRTGSVAAGMALYLSRQRALLRAWLGGLD